MKNADLKTQNFETLNQYTNRIRSAATGSSSVPSARINGRAMQTGFFKS